MEIKVVRSLILSVEEMMEKILECKLCGSRNYQFLYYAEDHYSRKYFSLVECSNCSLVYTNPRPKRDELNEYYPSSYYGDQGKRFNPIIERIVHYFRKQLANKISLKYPNGERILEVGSGRGTLMSEMAKKGWIAIGTEYSISLAKETEDSLGVVVYPTPDLQECNFPDQYFNVVVCNHVLEHLQDPISTLAEIRRILHPSGLLIIAVPNIGSLTARISKERWFGIDVPRHLFHFTPNTLKHALFQTGFQINNQTTLSMEQDIFGFAQSIFNILGFPHNIFYDFIRSPSGKMRHRFDDKISITKIYQYVSILTIGGALSIIGIPVSIVVSWFGIGGTLVFWSSPMSTSN